MKTFHIFLLLIFAFNLSYSQLEGTEEFKFATVSGNAFLQGQTDHSGIKVVFTAQSPSAVTDSTYTNAAGSYSISVAAGNYIIAFYKSGYQDFIYPGTHLFSGIHILNDVTLLPGNIEYISGSISGILFKNTIYIVTGDLTVDNNQTLTIQPGTNMRFDGYYSLTIYGVLIASGIEQDIIIFTSNKSIPVRGDWGGIYFQSNLNLANIISYSKIEYAISGIYNLNSNPTISNNVIQNNSNYGIYNYYQSNPTLTNNIIQNNNYFGICNSDLSNPILKNNIIQNNQSGILNESSNPTIVYNIIQNNNYSGISNYHCNNPTITSNVIRYNSHHGIYNFDSNPAITRNTILSNPSGIYSNSSIMNLKDNILAYNGTAVQSSINQMGYNNYFSNGTNFSSPPLGAGIKVTVNSRGDSCDTYYNIFENPGFVDSANGNFNLLSTSRMIDAGDPTSPKDPDSTITDIGAFYYHQGTIVPPVANFNASVTTGTYPLAVQFTNTSTGGPVTSFLWNFGDGRTGTYANPLNVYTQAGTYSVSLTVTGPGGSDTKTINNCITVTEPNIPPSANFKAIPLTGYAPLMVQFTNQTVGSVTSYHWEFGDGDTSNAQNPSHIYINPGTYTVSLTATNNFGSNTKTRVDYITVQTPPPILARFTSNPKKGIAPLTVSFSNQSLGIINTYRWYFGNGDSSNLQSPLHIYHQPGTYIVELAVIGDAGTSTAYDTIQVVSANPKILSISDVPDDQGGKVIVHWQRSGYDGYAGSQILNYSVWSYINNDWVGLGSISAGLSETYKFLALTIKDSSARNGIYWSKFKVSAHTSNASVAYYSEVDSGYSVDNLPPVSVEVLIAQSITPAETKLTWNKNRIDRDVESYIVYRSTTSGFPIGDETRLTTTSDTSFIDNNMPTAGIIYYKVTTIDVNDNESAPSPEVFINRQVSLQCNYNQGWNLVSVPATVSDYSKDSLFPGSVSNAFAYNGGYIPNNMLENKIGYWLKFPSPQNISIKGYQRGIDTIDVYNGWNLIGSISATIPVTEISSIPPGVITSQFYGYNAGYLISDNIFPGKAYWVKVNQSSKLILQSGLTENKINILSIQELPPPPPEGVLSVNDEIPMQYAIEQNYPNPFNPKTDIKFQLPVASKVRLLIYNELGEIIATHIDNTLDAGYKSIEWDAFGVSSGVYFYRIEAISVAEPSNSFVQAKRMILLK